MVEEREDKSPIQKELIRTKAKLAESEACYHMLIEHFPDNIMIHDLAGTILFTNESRVGVFGAISSKEVIGRNAMEFVHPDDREMVMAVIEDAVESYKKGDDSRRVVEHRMQRLDGTGFYCEATGVVFMYNGELAVQTVIRDVTARKRAQQALKESELRTIMAQKVGKIGTWDWAPNSGKLVWSDEIYSMLGLEQGKVEPTYELFLEKLHPEDRLSLEKAVKGSLSNKAPYRVDCRVIKEDGTELIAESMGKVEYGENGTPVRMFGTFKDITSRMRTEAKLKKSLQRHQALFDNMLSGAAYHKVIFDSSGAPIDYIFLEINDAFEMNTGLKREDVVGKLATEVIPGIKDVKPDLIELYGTVASTGKGCTFDLFLPPLNKWFTVSAYCPEKGFFVATFCDVTERKMCEIDLQQANVDLEKTVEARTERLSEANLQLGREVVERKKAGEKLKEADDRFRTIFESSNDATLLLGADGFTDFNGAALSVFGCTGPDELMGSRPADWSPARQPDGRGSVEAEKSEVERAFANGHSFFEWTFERADGELFPAEVLFTAMSIEGQEVVHSTIRDITVRRNLEDETMVLYSQLLQAQKMEAIGTLAGGIAHDFNNILTVVKSLGTLVLTKIESGSRVHEYIETLLRASERGTSLVQQLLIFSQSKPCEVVTLDLNDSINDLLVMLRSLIDEDIRIEERLGVGVCEIEGDRGRIEQVITNLIINSSDALPQGGDILITTENVTVTGNRASGKGVESPGEYVRMTIEDNGIGMDVETVEHIFEPFFTTKSPNGTGLGLSVVYGILKDMNGWIDVKSTQGEGTTFCVYLPKSSVGVEIDGPGRYVGFKEPAAEPAGGRGRRVLLVEDDMWVRRSTSMALVENGYEVLEARDAKEALSLFRKEPDRFDIVISDVVMPGMDGLQMMEVLLGIAPGISVLFYSGHIYDKARLDSIIKRGLPFLQKPYEITDLLRAVDDCIGPERE